MASNDLTRYSKDLVRRADAHFSSSNAQLRKIIELIDANTAASVQFIDSVRALTVYISSCNSDINDAQALRKLLADTLIYGRAAILASERVERAMIGGDTAADELKSIKNQVVRPPNMLISYLKLLIVEKEAQTVLARASLSGGDILQALARIQSMVDSANRNLFVSVEALGNAIQVSIETKIFIDLLEETGLLN